MRHWLRISGMAVLAVCFLGIAACRQEDVRTKTIRVPQMKNEECRRIILAALTKTEGVLPESITFADTTVTITYDSMKLAQKNLEFVIAEAGFDANGIPADTKARSALPAACL